MVWISRLFRLAAVLLALLFVVAFPLALTGRNLGQLVFHPGSISAVVSENLADNPRYSLNLLNQFSRFILSSPEAQTDPVAQLVRLGLRNLTEEDISALLSLTLPPELLADAFVQIVAGFYVWLDNDEPYPIIILNAAPLKGNLNDNRRMVLETVMNALPECSPDQLLAYVFSGDLANLENLPVCKPPEPIYSEFLNLADILIPAWLASLPDTFDISQPLRVSGQAENLLEIKANLLRTRAILRWTWVVVLVLYLLSIPMWARSWRSLLAWGWPLLLSGVICLGIATSLWLSAAGIPQLIVGWLFENTLGGFFDSVRTILADLVTMVARPLAWQGGIQAMVGLFSVGGAALLGALTRRKTRPESPTGPRSGHR